VSALHIVIRQAAKLLLPAVLLVIGLTLIQMLFTSQGVDAATGAAPVAEERSSPEHQRGLQDSPGDDEQAAPGDHEEEGTHPSEAPPSNAAPNDGDPEQYRLAAMDGRSAVDGKSSLAGGESRAEPDREAKDEYVEVAHSVGRGDTLFAMLLDAGVGATEALELIREMRTVHPPERLQAGQRLTLRFADEKRSTLRTLLLRVDPETQVVVHRESGALHAARRVTPLVSEPVRARGTIRLSLYQSARAQGVPNTVLMDLIGLLSFDVDFQRDIQPGNRFRIVYEEARDRDGKLVRFGDIVVAELEMDDRAVRMYRFTPADGRTDYFDPDGHSIRKTLLRTPVEGAALTSGFGYRKHPIRGYSHLHTGIDFATRIGTPVYAAGSGNVERVRRTDGYGKHVVLRHVNGFETLYAHLDAFARGVRPGVRVEQGQTIGYSGNTGLSTGPHLHYEVHLNHEPIDPTKLEFPPERQLTGENWAAFRELRGALDRAYFDHARAGPAAGGGALTVR
jgi:murein DD-endopeptidase MepM/ murein hydrolase activator NlpD